MLGGESMRIIMERARPQKRFWKKRRRKTVENVNVSALVMGRSVMEMMGHVGSCWANVFAAIVGTAMSIICGIIQMVLVRLRGSWESRQRVLIWGLFLVKVRGKEEMDRRNGWDMTANAQRVIMSTEGLTGSKTHSHLIVAVEETGQIIHARRGGMRVKTVGRVERITTDLF
jgi:hypothetical protein